MTTARRLPAIRWTRDAEGDLVAETGHYRFLIVADRDSWFGQKIRGWWLTANPGTSASRSLFFERQRDAKEFAAQVEADRLW